MHFLDRERTFGGDIAVCIEWDDENSVQLRWEEW